MNLRHYQTRMVDAIHEAWSDGHRRVLGCLPTGGGKTEVAIDIIASEATPTNRVLVIVDRKVLVNQWAERIRRHGHEAAGLMQGENTTRVYAPVVVGTAQSIRTRVLQNNPDLLDFSLIVIDESHIWHGTHGSVLEALPEARVLGLSATPLREGLGQWFDTMVVGSTIKELTSEGWLVGAKHYAPSAAAIETALADIGVRAGDYRVDQLSECMRNKVVIGDVVSGWKARGENRQTIAFCVDRQHAAELSDEFNAAGIPAAAIIDETPDDTRAELFARFNRGDLRIMCSVGVLSIGFDSPVASCAILARPTLSTALYVQQGGRVLRPYEGKDFALILDHAANTQRHGLLIDFEPPEHLSLIDKTVDKKSRKEKALSWVCRGCEALNPIEVDVCEECGMARYRQTTACLVDGELVPYGHEPGEVLPGPTASDIEVFYRMMLTHAEDKGLKPGIAFFKTKERFKLSESGAKRIIDYEWRFLEPLPLDDEAARWVRNDYLRWKLAKQHREASSVY